MGIATVERLGQREQAGGLGGCLRTPVSMLGYQAHNSRASGGVVVTLKDMESMGPG